MTLDPKSFSPNHNIPFPIISGNFNTGANKPAAPANILSRIPLADIIPLSALYIISNGNNILPNILPNLNNLLLLIYSKSFVNLVCMKPVGPNILTNNLPILLSLSKYLDIFIKKVPLNISSINLNEFNIGLKAFFNCSLYPNKIPTSKTLAPINIFIQGDFFVSKVLASDFSFLLK